MKKWLLHEQMLRNPQTDRMRHVHMLHHTQSVLMLDENSALRGNMPRQMGRAWTTDGCNAPRTTETIAERDNVAFFHQFFGLTNNPALAPFATVPCRCKRYFPAKRFARSDAPPETKRAARVRFSAGALRAIVAACL
jgi:hypothetical protein